MKWINLCLLLLLVSCSVTEGPDLNKPLIVITIDDQHDSIYQNALPILAAHGYCTTSFINTAVVGSNDLLSWVQVEELEFDYHWETGGHTLHHHDLTSLTLEEAEYEIHQDWLNLKAHGLSHDSFALPSGHATAEQFDIIGKYYKNIRSSNDLRHVQPLNRKYLGYFAYLTEYTAKDAIDRILQACERQEVVVILGFHRFLEDSAGHPRNCRPEDFQKIIDFIYENDFQVLTLKQACDYLAD
ncbi:MAG TPA: polysaccharide deacetylase family protein [Candidatus Cloacimonadota bacterium]|nr:polysaccharide deacetylase family protein [Candidatus Cloacimonadota bacterium]